MEWISVKTDLPPFGHRVWWRGVVTWATKEDRKIKYFSDVLTQETETLEYGNQAYLLDEYTDFLCVNTNWHDFKELASEYVTHWAEIIPPKE